ncbi:MAG: Holliday junction resolvase RuvX [Acidimicrobiales bacterium]|nr:Holliday junction resolvase RuvX [Hyphomonadaceae bacterium]RZV37677.1 MAG: Holliday junction resolvase RuvX [Acidimicrobiales bacterium]
MSIITLKELAKTKGPLLGIDPGSKTFGIAVSDLTRLIASPIETIKRKKFTKDAQQIFAHFDDKECSAIVIGYPVNMDGSEGPRTQSVKDFATNLLGVRDIPIVFWDERLSTAAVTRTLLTADTSRAKRAESVDKLAATYLLQGLLDRLRT